MRKRFVAVIVLSLVLGPAAGGLPEVLAHECGYDEEHPEECRETPVVDNWRDNYIPLFDLEDRDDPEQRRDAQRWREECQRDGEHRQMCVWSYGGFSVVPDDGDASPNEWHLGVAATHCFLFELAHQCEEHDASQEEGVHDTHGGALYVSICLTPNAESRRCSEGMEGTEAGVTIIDHFPCGMIVPIVSCIDEYHIVRPFDDEYTARQMDNSQDAIELIVADPRRYLCGYGPGSDTPWCEAIPGDG